MYLKLSDILKQTAAWERFHGLIDLFMFVQVSRWSTDLWPVVLSW